jgi:plastocyanin
MGRDVKAAALTAFVLLGGTAAATGGPVSGTVRTEARSGVTPALAVVYAEPLDGAAPRRPGTFALNQRHKTFLPSVLAVPAGSTVAFPNDDLIYHNVFSLSGPQPFDLGLYRAGDSRERRFDRPGVYRVFCNIHPQMTALVVVVPTPYVTVADASGRYTLELPPGRYRLTALSERSAPVFVEITAGPGSSAAVDVRLDESRWAAVPHLNKHGLPYPSAAYSR